MDLLGDTHCENGNVILLLPGSRKSAISDVATLLGAVEILAAHGFTLYRMVLAPTLNFEAFFKACELHGWLHNGNNLVKHNSVINLSYDDIATASDNALILLGMGGTANQLCAGLGIPVIAPDNKGKRVQKKLLGNSEILTCNSPIAFAECALNVLHDKKLYSFMSHSGKFRMGLQGACNNVVTFTREALGWGVREYVYSKLIPSD